MSRRVALSTGREHTGDPQTDALWREIRSINQFLNLSPFASGRLITEEENGVAGSGLSFTAGTARSIAHKLGRKAKGFVEVYGADVTSAARVGLYATAHPTGTTSATHVTVTPTSTGTAYLLVF